MTRARAHLVDVENGGFYHCISRCVRRGWLCGMDIVSGRSYEHRKAWVEERILLLSRIFAVEVYGYAVMSNHYHVVVQVNPRRVGEWSDAEVIRRWVGLCGPGDERGRANREAALTTDPERIACLRERLGSLSWFMRCLNEPIARQANREERCTGRFWEGRFKSMALLDETALLSCMAYVDLNPIRAKLVCRVEDCPHTSIARRLGTAQGAPPRPALGDLAHVGLSLDTYLDLLRWSATRQSVQASSRPQAPPPALARLKHSGDGWLSTLNSHRHKFRAYGALHLLGQYARRLGQSRIRTFTPKTLAPAT